MTDTIIHVGDDGTVFELTILDTKKKPINVSTASLRVIHFMKPDRTRVTKTATLTTNGVDGKIQYKSVAGDIDMAGEWIMQGFVKFSDGNGFFSEKPEFPVITNIAHVDE